MVFKFYLFIFREGNKERERNLNVWLALVHPLLEIQDLAHHPGLCPRLGIELATLWFTGRRSIH